MQHALISPGSPETLPSVLQGMPLLAGTSTQLRRHGDEVARLPGGFYRALGRADDTMNLGGIKVRPDIRFLGPVNLSNQLLGSRTYTALKHTMNLGGIKVRVWCPGFWVSHLLPGCS